MVVAAVVGRIPAAIHCNRNCIERNQAVMSAVVPVAESPAAAVVVDNKLFVDCCCCCCCYCGHLFHLDLLYSNYCDPCLVLSSSD